VGTSLKRSSYPGDRWYKRRPLPDQPDCRIEARCSFPEHSDIPGWCVSPGFMVPAVRGRTTQVGFFYRTPPPWPRGNCFGVTTKARWLGPARGTGASEWNVANMHAENFSVIAARLSLRTVEIQPIGGGSCLITDPRVPREWLLEEPCRSCYRGPAREEIRKRYSQYFRAPHAR
jgi:hypothetical protein